MIAAATSSGLVCGEFVELVADYLEARCPTSGARASRRTWPKCDGCAGYLEDVRRLVGSLHEAPEPPPDPATREAAARLP
jgi:hypothetical protein